MVRCVFEIDADPSTPQRRFSQGKPAGAVNAGDTFDILGLSKPHLAAENVGFLLCVERGRYRAATTAAAGAVFLPADPPCAPAPSEGFERAWAPGPALDRTGKGSYM